EARSDLLFAVAFQQARERLTKPWREPLDATPGGARERPANQPADLRVEELDEALLSWCEVSFADRLVQCDAADRAVIGDLQHGRRRTVDTAHPPILGGDQHVQPFEHAPVAERGMAIEVAPVAGQAIGVAHVAEPEAIARAHVVLRRWSYSLTVFGQGRLQPRCQRGAEGRWDDNAAS